VRILAALSGRRVQTRGYDRFNAATAPTPRESLAVARDRPRALAAVGGANGGPECKSKRHRAVIQSFAIIIPPGQLLPHTAEAYGISALTSTSAPATGRSVSTITMSPPQQGTSCMPSTVQPHQLFRQHWLRSELHKIHELRNFSISSAPHSFPQMPRAGATSITDTRIAAPWYQHHTHQAWQARERPYRIG
jgi:hypothetical protein